MILVHFKYTILKHVKGGPQNRESKNNYPFSSDVIFNLPIPYLIVEYTFP